MLIGLDRIHKAARKERNIRFTSLMHHITQDLLRDSFYSLKRKAKRGEDDVIWQQYSEQLEVHLPDPHERVQSGRYKAMPSKKPGHPKLTDDSSHRNGRRGRQSRMRYSFSQMD